MDGASLQTTMETGLDGPAGDVEDLGHLRKGQVEVVVQDDDGPLVDVEATELASEPLTLGDAQLGVGDAGAARRRASRAARPGSVAAPCLRPCSRHAPWAAEPRVPRVRIAERTHVSPGFMYASWTASLALLRVAEDEVGDALRSCGDDAFASCAKASWSPALPVRRALAASTPPLRRGASVRSPYSTSRPMAQTVPAQVRRSGASAVPPSSIGRGATTRTGNARRSPGGPGNKTYRRTAHSALVGPACGARE